MFQSLCSRAGSFDNIMATMTLTQESQSLWNRAGSFDSIKERQQSLVHRVSIPLEQGRVFRQHSFTFIYNCKFVSIPLEQGRVFRH